MVSYEMTISFCKESVTNDKRRILSPSLFCVPYPYPHGLLHNQLNTSQHACSNHHQCITISLSGKPEVTNRRLSLKSFIELSRPVSGAYTDKTLSISSHNSINSLSCLKHVSCHIAYQLIQQPRLTCLLMYQ